MAGPGGTERGRIAIRVLPDTSNFAQSLQRYLDRTERRARIKVQAVPDLSQGFRDRLNRDLSRVRAKVKVRVDPDLSAFGDTLRTRLQTRAATLNARLEIKDAEIARLRRELAHLEPPLTINAHINADRSQTAQLEKSLGSLAKAVSGAASGLGGLLGTVAKLGSMAGTIPSMAGLVSGLVQMAPAAALAAPAVLTMASAGAALKIGMKGVAEALKGDADALAKLSPQAKAFVAEVKSLGPAWEKVQKSVQGALFKDMGTTLDRVSKSVLPVLKTQLTGTAGALNLMGRQVLNTADGLARSGALGKAMGGATVSLKNLSALPATLVQGLVQVGAAATPAFTKLTAAGGHSLDALSQKMASAFKSGAMQKGIEKAIGLAGSFFTTLGNLGQTLANVFGPAATAGAGFLGVLSEIAAKAAAITSTPQAQATFTALFETLASIGHLVSTVLGAALEAALPILSTLVNTLAGPLQTAVAQLGPVFAQLIKSLGQGLGPVVGSLAGAFAQVLPVVVSLASGLATALGPVLGALGGAFAAILPVVVSLASALATALRPILGAVAETFKLLAPVLADLAKSAGQALIPIVRSLSGILAEIVPIAAQLVAQIGTALGPVLIICANLFRQVAGILMTALRPILQQLPGILGPLLVAFGALVAAVAPIVSQLLEALAPALAKIGESIGQLAVALGPLIEAAGVFLVQALAALMPVIQPLIGLVADLAAMLADNLASLIQNVVLPAIQLIVAILQGDFSRAWQAAKDLLSGVLTYMGDVFSNMKALASKALGKVVDLFGGMASGVWRKLQEWGSGLADSASNAMNEFGRWISGGINTVYQWFADLPGNIVNTLGDMGRLLVRAGIDLLNGFLDGISSMWSSVKNKLNGLTDMLPDWKGPARRDRTILAPAGRLVLDGFMDGIEDRIPGLKRQLTGITGTLPDLIGTGPQVSVSQSAQPAWSADLVDVLRQYADRDVVVKVGEQELARAAANGMRQLARR
ncbi:hypothetical protein [Streptomyces sp. NPDC001828]|uniref:phage tail protein n=1 Tax=Streptomyces sp. NPDC001828 TaxID=3364615 RepID=UPI0036B0E237